MSQPHQVRVAFQGEPGAFSAEAIHAAFGDGAAALPRRTFEEMFDAVRQGDADLAMAPIENTLAGSVIKNYDLLVEHDLVIAAEVILRIVHNLIVAPGVTLGELRRVYSHPVALAQCERFLARHPQLQVVPAYDTAGAVKDLLAGGRRDEAAIAGAAAARAWGGEILAAGIESNAQNYTRFLVLRDPARPPAPALTSALATADTARKTSIVLRLANRPGGLYRALAAFAEEAIDLTKIESRPIPGRPWEYSFYLDFLGDPDGDVPGPGAVARALTRLRASAEFLRVLGAYPTLKV